MYLSTFVTDQLIHIHRDMVRFSALTGL